MINRLFQTVVDYLKLAFGSLVLSAAAFCLVSLNYHTGWRLGVLVIEAVVLLVGSVTARRTIIVWHHKRAVMEKKKYYQNKYPEEYKRDEED